MRVFLLSSLAVWLLFPSAAVADENAPLIQPGDRVVFLGDSNTFAGGYVTHFEAQLLQTGNFADVEVLNLGLPSETASGLSEPDHPFPRPNVHERLKRVLEKTRPDVVFACYGMNDAIYYPFDKQRFEAYQAGINKLIDQVQDAGAKVVILTPPPFDPLPLKKRGGLLAKDAEKYSWTAVFENYDRVMRRYSKWIRNQAERVDRVINIRQPLVRFVKQERIENPDFAMSGDGVHLDDVGHALMARAILDQLGIDANRRVDPQLLDLVSKRQEILKLAWLTETGHQRPGIQPGLPLDEAQAAARELDTRIAARVANLKRPQPLAEIEDTPGLPRVLLIGDSISIGYTLDVRELLDGVANVHRPPTNCGPTTKGLEQIDAWLGDGKWDVIHFNWGLHDLKYVKPGSDGLADVAAEGSRQQVPLQEYQANLERLVERLKQTGAKLIWRTTTPVPEGADGRVPGDAARYNAAALEIVQRHGIAIDDMYAYSMPRLKEIQRPANVHFSPAGSRFLAEHVAEAIKQNGLGVGK